MRRVVILILTLSFGLFTNPSILSSQNLRNINRQATQPINSTKKASNSSTSKTSNSNTSSRQTTTASASSFKTYYLCWGSSYQGAAWVGEGSNAKQIQIKINGNNLTYRENGKDVTLPFAIEKNGIRRYRGSTNNSGYWIDVIYGGEAIKIYHFMPDFSAMTYEEYLVPTTAERDRNIAENRSKTKSGDYTTPIPNHNNNHTGSSEAKLRYPEYQKYNDRNGRWDDKKYRQETQRTCNLCNGTGINPNREYTANGRSAMHNNTGDKCPICGHYDKHYHDRCPSCQR